MENAPLDKKKLRSKGHNAETDPSTEAEKSPEHIGHMLMSASEKAPISHTGKSALEAVGRKPGDSERPAEHSPGPAAPSRIETLNRAALLSLSEQIVVDGSSLRQIYETHLIGERGLRRLVAEHERGGDLKKALRSEIVAREMDFERDPAMRDMDMPQWSSSDHVSKNDQKALNELLDQAAASLDGTSEEAAFFKARSLYEVNQLQKHKQQRRLIDISLALAIAVLLVLVIILLSRR